MDALLLLAAGRRDRGVDLDNLTDGLGDLALPVLGAAIATAALLTCAGRWPWPELTRGPWLRWTWAPAFAVAGLLIAAATAALGSRLVTLAALGVALGALASAWALWRGERDDATSQNPRRRRRSERRLGPEDLARRARLRRAYERGQVKGLSPTLGRARREAVGGIAVGRDRRGFPAVLSKQQLLRSGIITGTVGSGKTTTARWVVSRMIRGGFGAIWVEAKGDPEMRDWLMAEAALVGSPFYEFRISGGSQNWNPLAAAAGPVERRDLISQATAAAARQGPEYFNSLFKEHALLCLEALEFAGREPSLPAVKAVWSPDTLKRLLRSAGDDRPELVRAVGELSEERNARRRAEIESTAVRLADVVDACGGRLETAGGEDSIDLRAVVKSCAVCLISLDAATYPAVTKALGQLVVADAMAACAPWIERRELARCVLALDEFPRYSGPQVGELMALTARQAGMPVILLTQDLADLDNVSTAFRSQVMGCANWLGVHHTGSPDSADYLGRAGGQRERIEATQQVHRNALGLERTTGLGTEAYGREWVIHPDQLQELDTGCLGLITQNPHTARIVRAYYPESGAELLKRLNEARAGRSRPPLDLAGLANLHAAARRHAAAALAG